MVSDSSLLKTPQRRTPAHRNNTPSIYLTPSKTHSHSHSRHHHGQRSHHRGSAMTIPRMSPMPHTQQRRSSLNNNGMTPGATPYYTPRRHGTPSTASSMITADDRFIPSRRNMNISLCRRALLTGEKRSRDEANGSSSSLNNSSHHSNNSNNNSNSNNDDSADSSPSTSRNDTLETPLQKEFKRRMLSSLCNVPLEQLSEDGQPTGLFSYRSNKNQENNHPGNGSSSSSLFGHNNNHNSSFPSLARLDNPYSHDTLRTVLEQVGSEMDPTCSHNNGISKKMHRKVSAAPTRILDAPDIVNDYYLQLISWSKDNILAVALAQSVYLWNATTGEIQHLVTTETQDDYITSVAWCTMPGKTKYIAVGTNANAIHIYDAEVLQKVRTLAGHSGRVCSLAWSHQWLTSGARDSLILQHDIRSVNNIVSTYEGHEQEVCGLKWNEEGSTLASGGNENYLCLWDAAMSGRSSFQQRQHRSNSTSSNDSVAPRLTLTQHKAAVKALDWCPFHRGLLASGGGTADRTIKFWNSSSGAMLNSIDTGSQVCSVLWSKHQREICSSHGYSENQLILWKYPTMTKIKELTGHTERVLNMDVSPDGASVVSAAADETLRFWNVFGTPSYRPTASTGLSMTGELSFGMPTIR